jgi:NADH-quinone oxidoreductase subunit D
MLRGRRPRGRAPPSEKRIQQQIMANVASMPTAAPAGPSKLLRRSVEQTVESPEYMTLNVGPVHPSTHGVLRLIVDLEGETVVSVRSVLGYLHRAKEKLAEVKTYTQWIPYTDRMDYLAPMSNNTGYVMTVEKALGIDVTEKCKWLRMTLCELARISAHCLWMGTGALELGAMTPFMYSFRERESIYDIFEWISGARFTVSYMRAGGVARDIPEGWIDMVARFADGFEAKADEWETLLTNNPIFLGRTKDIGVLSKERAIALGMSGPVARASGVAWDIRKHEPYLLYDQVNFEAPVGRAGDVFERYLIRMEEMRQSARIIQQCVPKLRELEKAPVNIDNPKVVYPPREKLHTSMETLIHHFLLASEGFQVPAGEVYHAIEAPKGELGFYIVADGGSRPYRVKVRSPSFTALQALGDMCAGHTIADLVAIIASIDIVLGDVDR